ncbi:MAG TPA: tripartite tricarboxylate transporter substrate binding protein [Xanthobacteraceae bacterium]|nr:tripartite tricarboxylate transporter substrate binding protein [Xanthobacteraceae bacterium]
MKLAKIAASAIALLAWLTIGIASAQEAAVPALPSRGVIEITVLFPAGSSADVTARLLAEGMSRRLDNKVIVVNRPGAGGAIGYRYVAGQMADGHSLVWSSNSVSTTHHMGLLQLDYRSFTPVAQVLVESPVVAVRGDARWHTLAELIADAKARPEAITVGNSGVGSHTHITSVALFRAAGARVVDVPFGAAEVITSLLGGQVDAVVQLPAALSEYVKNGQVRLLASMTDIRDPAFPDVPTAQELGLKVSLEAWRGISAPKDTAAPIVATLEAAIRDTVASPEFVQTCLRLGARPAFLPADRFGRLIAAQDPELAQLMEVIGLKK